MGHGRMSFGLKTIRLIMVLCNVVFFIIGAALLALGIYVIVDPRFQKLKEFLPLNSNAEIEKGLSYLEMMAIVVIILGSILLIIGFLGCCGAMKQVKLFLTCYAMIIALIIIVEIAITVYFVIFQTNFKDRFVPTLQMSLKNTYEGPVGLIGDQQEKPSPSSLAWDFIMYNFECCGVLGKTDFFGTIRWNRTNPWWTSPMPITIKEFMYPLTCCPMNKARENWNSLPLNQLQQAGFCALNGTNIYEVGCYSKLVDFVQTGRTWVIIVASVILIIQLFAFIFTLALCCRRKKDTLYYSS